MNNDMTTLYRTVLAYLGQALVVIGLILCPLSARAAAPITALDIAVNLEQAGIITVTQAIEYSVPQQLHWTLFSPARGITATADGKFTDSRTSRDGGNTVVTAKVVARNWQLQYQTPSNLIRHNNRDQLFLKIFDQPGAIIYTTTVTFTLPTDNPDSGLTGNLYAIGGVEDPQTDASRPNQLTYSAGFVGPAALLTISANWSKDVLALSPVEEARLAFYQLDAAPWLALGVLLPLASLIVLARLLLAQRRSEQVVGAINQKPPSALPAIIAGVVVRKKIYPEEIAALIIDFCQRGYLLVVKRSQTYYLVRRKPADNQLQAWERQIIEELLPEQDKTATAHYQLDSQSLYSPRVRGAFNSIYQIVTNQGYFTENPHQTRITYKLFALFLYFASAGGMIWLAISAGSPYLILPLAGTIIVSQLIIRASPRIAHYSAAGIIERQKWLAFSNFLAETKPLPFEMARNHTFEKYLPYAVALDKTLPWAKRFDYSSITIVKPDWFVAYEDSSTVEFAKEISAFVKEIAAGITTLRGPLVG
ncbi:MAG: hypothetical protein WEC83_01500 [Patescibacteria group bacterium]